MNKRNVIVHCHIFKNAGSTFDDSLLANFGKGFVDHRQDNFIRNDKEFLKSFLHEHENVEAFSSHSIYFTPENFENLQLHAVYFLRHPIERIRSVYSFEKKQPASDSSGAKMAKELDFVQYVEWRMKDNVPATIRNLQTVFLGGIGPHPKHMDEKYAQAIKKINELPLIGVVDRYDESVIVMEEYLRDFFSKIDLSYIRRNVTDTDTISSIDEKAQKLLSQLDEKLQEEVLEKNEYDLKLYKKANELLDKKISDIDKFEHKLQNFRDRCLVKQIRLKEKNKEFQEIVEILEPVISDKQTTNIHLYLAYAKSKKELEKYEEALRAYETIIKMFPNNPWAYFHEVEMHKLIGNEQKAQELFKSYAVKFKQHVNIVDSFKKIIG